MVDMTTLIIATRNLHKVGEIRSILGDGFQYQTLNDFPGAPEVVEDAATFSGNAAKKATGLAGWLMTGPVSKKQKPGAGTFVLADDSGLEVDALGGAPGVYSARYAALDSETPGNSKDADNNSKLLRLLKEVPSAKRTARFRCIIALTPLDRENGRQGPEFFEGVCEGRIQLTAAGSGGFGYDPLFVPDGFEITFAELGEESKNRISHRARALAALRATLTQAM